LRFLKQADHGKVENGDESVEEEEEEGESGPTTSTAELRQWSSAGCRVAASVAVYAVRGGGVALRVPPGVGTVNEVRFQNTGQTVRFAYAAPTLTRLSTVSVHDIFHDSI
jgi:hypothetical protein